MLVQLAQSAGTSGYIAGTANAGNEKSNDDNHWVPIAHHTVDKGKKGCKEENVGDN
jgi:hypothetical protein